MYFYGNSGRRLSILQWPSFRFGRDRRRNRLYMLVGAMNLLAGPVTFAWASIGSKERPNHWFFWILTGAGWGTWIRTKIDGVRVRCSTVELSPNGRFSRAGRRLRAMPASIAKRTRRRKRLASGHLDHVIAAPEPATWTMSPQGFALGYGACRRAGSKPIERREAGRRNPRLRPAPPPRLRAQPSARRRPRR
jgi:hypothetical protein